MTRKRHITNTYNGCKEQDESIIIYQICMIIKKETQKNPQVNKLIIINLRAFSKVSRYKRDEQQLIALLDTNNRQNYNMSVKKEKEMTRNSTE